MGGVVFYAPLFVSAGLGLQYTRSATAPHADCSGWFCVSSIDVFYGDGLRPRLLASAGLAL